MRTAAGAISWFAAILLTIPVPGCGSGGSPATDRDVPGGGPDVVGDPGQDEAPSPDPAPETPVEDVPFPDGSAPEPLLLLEAQIPDDRGLFDADPRLPLDPRGGFLRPLRISPCGTMAFLFRNLKPRPDGTWDYSLALQQAAPWNGPPGPRTYLATATGQAEPPPIASWITFASDACEPRVWRLSDQEPRLVQWVPRPDGSMTPAPVLWDLATPLGAEPTRLEAVALGDDRQGDLHLLVRADLGAMGSPLVHLWLRQGAWTVTRVPPAPFLADLDQVSFAFGADGAVHAALVQEDGIRWAVMRDRAWSTEVALALPADGVLLDSVHLALGAYDIPLVAHRHVQTLDQGLWQYLRLDLALRPSGSDWQRETVADRNGTWRGDTDRFTGGAPRVFVTPRGRWWVSWLDLARIASPDGPVTRMGGPRLAVRTDSGWSLREVLPRSPSRYPPSRFDVAEAVAVDLDPQARTYGALVLERERPEGQAPDAIATAWWRLWLVRGSL